MQTFLRHHALRGLVAFSIGVTLSLAASALAHTVGDYYHTNWAADRYWGIGYTSGDVATPTAWTSIQAGDDPWNAVSGAWFDFAYLMRDNSVTWTDDVCNMPAPKGWVLSADPGPGRVGNTYTCGGVTLTAFAVLLHPDANWYVGSGTPSGSEYDLRSRVVHELGHANGFHGPNDGHFPADDTVCTTSPIHTMCSGATPGTTYRRTLETHEKDLFAAAY